ncbi:MAG: myxococcus cysteine-rich repeat containing protein, partial [Nanoarchaeota archaeon]|nr:myxococcus cysteine-rich repeat containing protein [Nanoarchaeota archaeon]
MKRRVQKVYKRLPPHTYEAHPVANAGEASKPLIIGIIAIVAVIALSLLLLFSDQIVGKAFFTGEMNSAGAEVVPSKVYENQPFSLKVKANTGGKETNVVGFELDLAPGMTCDNVQSIQNLLGWDVESKSMCDAAKNKIIFEYATFGAGKSGTFDVAQIVIVPGFAQGDFQFDLGPFQAFDSNNMNIITNVLDPIVQVKKAVCGDGDKAPSEQCDDGNVVNGDGCSSTCMTEQVQPQQVQLQCANPPSGLVSKWSGDESTKDDLGNSADGSLKGGATFASGKVG